jgi:hypothetical protein
MELEKHKVDDAVTVDKKRDNNNDIQRSEEKNEHHDTLPEKVAPLRP